MSETMAIILILLLPGAWGVVFLIRTLMGSGFKSKDHLAKEGALLTGEWQMKQQNALHRMEHDPDVICQQEELDRQAATGEHAYPVRPSKAEQMKKTHHIGEEKEATFPEIKRPK